MSANDDNTFAAGAQVAQYRIVRRLGAGGMGEVFLAEDTKLDRLAALKILPRDFADDVARRKRFLAEARAASALNHPNVCTIYEVGETNDGRPFIAMEYLEGHTLDALAKHRRLTLAEIANIGAQVAEALAAAADKHIVHRDIKPANISVDRHRRVKVLDFGLARRSDAATQSETTLHTQSGAMPGTPGFLSPEQALGREVDSRSDIFSLGVVLYELASGRHPFAGVSFGETINNILNCRPEPLRPWNPTLSPEFERIVFKCLEKSPLDRYATPAELARDLEGLKTGLVHRTSAKGQTIWLAAATVVVLAGIVALIWFGPKHSQQSSSAAQGAGDSLNRHRIVVLPLKSISSDEANEIFADGLAVELFSKLAKISHLQVIDGAGFVKSQEATKDLSGKWRALNAGVLLKGTVLKEQKKLRIRLQLLDSQTQELLHSFDFDREPESVLAVQSEAAEAIASALEVQLLADERAELSRRPTENTRAYQSYLEGRAFWSRFTEAGWHRSIELFNEAIRFDTNFALAHAGLADSYIQLSADFMPPREAFALAKANAQRALDLQPDLAPAYVSLGQCRMWFDRDYTGARQAFETALRLQPRYPDTYHFFGHLHEVLGQMPQAIELFKQAIERDPLAPVLQTELGWAYFHARRYADGAAQCEKVLALDPTFDYARAILALNQFQLGRTADAVTTLESASKALGWAGAFGYLGYAYGAGGKTREARAILQQLRAIEAKGPWLPPSALGYVHLGLGETNEALAQFARAIETHDPYIEWINVEPWLDSLRNEPRFQMLVRKLNLPE